MLREYSARALGLPDLLNFAALVEEGVVLNKDGAFLAGWWYAGPDMESASNEELAILSSHVNAALVRLGNGWMLQADAVRRPAGGYAPPGAFPDPTTALIDDERRRQYVAGRSTYESVYALTVTFLPPRDVQARLGGWFVEGETQDRSGYEAVLRFFQRHIVELEDALSDRLSVSRMVSEDLLSFLHLCVTGISQPVSIPAAPSPSRIRRGRRSEGVKCQNCSHFSAETFATAAGDRSPRTVANVISASTILPTLRRG